MTESTGTGAGPRTNSAGDTAHDRIAKGVAAKRFQVQKAEKGGGVELPDVPAPDDLAGLRAWLDSVLRLDPAHRVTGVERQGLRGPRRPRGDPARRLAQSPVRASSGAGHGAPTAHRARLATAAD